MKAPYRDPTKPFWRELRFHQRFLVLQFLKQAEGNISRAANLAGVQRPSFQRWMRGFGITIKRSPNGARAVVT